jgi:hypothetical protein
MGANFSIQTNHGYEAAIELHIVCNLQLLCNYTAGFLGNDECYAYVWSILAKGVAYLYINPPQESCTETFVC